MSSPAVTVQREDIVKKSNKINAVAAAALAVISLASPSAFADSRPAQETWRARDSYSQNDNRSDRAYRNNERVTVQGKVQSFTHERGGYRVRLDRGNQSYWIPENRIGNGVNIRVGIDIVLGGVYRNDSVYVDDVAYGGYGYQNDGYVRGVVDRIDYRYGTLVLRDDRSGQFISVDMRDTARRSRIDLNDLRRGDRVSLNGNWSRGGVFRAYEISSVNTGRY
jgi:hypothetical protein